MLYITILSLKVERGFILLLLFHKKLYLFIFWGLKGHPFDHWAKALGFRWPPLRWPGVANEPLAIEGVANEPLSKPQFVLCVFLMAFERFTYVCSC